MKEGPGEFILMMKEIKLYGYKSDSIVGINLDGDILRSVKIPSSKISTIQFSSTDYNKKTFAIRGDTIYYSDINGIYCALKDENEVSMIIDSDELAFLNENFTLVDMAVNTKGEIFVLAINGLDEEWPTDLFILESKE